MDFPGKNAIDRQSRRPPSPAAPWFLLRIAGPPHHDLSILHNCQGSKEFSEKMLKTSHRWQSNGKNMWMNMIKY